jgi:hypothetical protein
VSSIISYQITPDIVKLWFQSSYTNFKWVLTSNVIPIHITKIPNKFAASPVVGKFWSKVFGGAAPPKFKCSVFRNMRRVETSINSMRVRLVACANLFPEVEDSPVSLSLIIPIYIETEVESRIGYD